MMPQGLAAIESAVGAEIVVDGQRLVNFGGSSYLGLSSNSDVLAAGITALREFGSGVPFLRGQNVATQAHLALEHQARAFFDSESALFIASGYLFGFIALAANRDRYNSVFYDELCHYSLVEAIAASRLEAISYRHLDAGDLEEKLRRHLRPAQRPMVVTDGLFGTYGRIPPLSDLAHIVEPYGGRLVVDESHSFGVLGSSGRGALEHCRVSPQVAVAGGSLGKAFGTCGGVIPASAIEVAAYRASPAGLGAGGGLPAAAAMCAASLEYVREHPELLSRLRSNVRYLKGGLRKLGLEVEDNIAPVATFETRAGKSMKELRQQLMSDGIFVYHSTYVGAGSEGAIRCGIFADHAEAHMDCLLDALRRYL